MNQNTAFKGRIMAILIALLHCIPPIIGALMGGKNGLVIGTIIGVVVAFAFGSRVFVIEDLFCVAIGYAIGHSRVSANH